jgi:hypothetical protein
MNIRRLAYSTVFACYAFSLCAQENSLYLAPPSVPHPASMITNLPVPMITSATAASNGRDFLVAWSDNRAATQSLMATRISPDGALMDAYPIRIATSLYGSTPILLASLGEDYLFSFVSSPALPVNGQTRSVSEKLVGLSSLGTLFGYPGIELSDSFYYSTIPGPQFVAGPQSALLFPSRNSNASQTYRLIFSDHEISAEFPITTETGTAVALGSAASRNGFMVAWRSGNYTRVSRISPEGELLDPKGITLPFLSSPLYVAGNDDSWLVVARDTTCVRLSSDGVILTPKPVHIPLPPGFPTAPFLLSGTGDGWEAASVFGNQLSIHQFSSTGALLGRTVSAVDISYPRPSIARNTHGDYLIAWVSTAPLTRNLVFYAIKPRDADLIPVRSVPFRQPEPLSAISRSASEFAFLSLEFQSPSGLSLQFQRLDLQGHPLTPSPLRLQTFESMRPSSSTNYALAAGSLDDTHLLVIGYSGRLHGYLVGPDNQFPVFATFQTGETIPVRYDDGTPIHIARSQNDFLVFWGSGLEQTVKESFVMRVSQSGQIVAHTASHMSWADLDGKLLAFYQLPYAPDAVSMATADRDLRGISLPGLPSWPGARPKVISNSNGAFATWETSTNSRTLRASYFTEIPKREPASIELFRFNYQAEYSLAASDHGYLIYGAEKPQLSYGNLPEARTFAFYYEAATGKILSNIVEGASQFASLPSVVGGESDFLATYSSSAHDLQAVLQWIRPTQSTIHLATPKLNGRYFITTFNATLDRGYQIEASDDLVNWRPVAELTGSGTYDLSTESTAPQGFFRAIPNPE